MIQHLALLPLALLIGIVLGALGSGGAILTLPVLVYAAGLEMRQAVGVSQVVVGTAALFGTFLQWRHGHIAVRQAALFAVSGIPAAKLGGWVGKQADPRVLMLTFGVIVLLAGWRVLRSVNQREKSGESWVLSLVLGGAVGFLTGMLGVGGGFLLVPALVSFGGLDTRRAAATSLPVIAVNSAIGAWENYAGWVLQLGLASFFLLATLLGTFVGVRVARVMSERKLRHALGWVLIVVGVAVAGLNLFRV